MKYKEALKVIELNKDRLSTSMRIAVETVLEEAKKVAAARAVLTNRMVLLMDMVERWKEEGHDVAEYEGKIEGYSQAVDLLGEKLESITIELEEV